MGPANASRGPCGVTPPVHQVRFVLLLVVLVSISRDPPELTQSQGYGSLGRGPSKGNPNVFMGSGREIKTVA